MSTIKQRVETALTTLQRGGLVIVTDDDHREAEGDMVGLAQFVSVETVNKMVTNARGLLCAPMSQDIATSLGLTPMVAHGNDAFTVSADAKTTSTGISAVDRADTLRQLADPKSRPGDFYHPGHVFPLIAKEHGTLVPVTRAVAKWRGASPKRF